MGSAQPRELRPRTDGWVEIPTGDLLERLGLRTIAVSAWQRGPACAISALELAEYPDGNGFGPQWHVSVSRMGKRPKWNDVRATLRAFGIVTDAEEDNHHPGNARHFWVPLDPARRVECQCKADEDLVVDPDGYVWTNPKDGACRGCEFSALIGKPCPLHPEVRHA
jgi:hypothetical protein